MKKNTELMANGQAVRMMKMNGADFICLTDIARFKNPGFPADVVWNWMRSKMTVALLGLWEQLHNPNFNMVEFDQFRNEAGTHLCHVCIYRGHVRKRREPFAAISSARINGIVR